MKIVRYWWKCMITVCPSVSKDTIFVTLWSKLPVPNINNILFMARNFQFSLTFLYTVYTLGYCTCCTSFHTITQRHKEGLSKGLYQWTNNLYWTFNSYEKIVFYICLKHLAQWYGGSSLQEAKNLSFLIHPSMWEHLHAQTHYLHLY